MTSAGGGGGAGFRTMSVSTRSMSVMTGPGPGGKAFGGITYMNKEEHERERSRWINKMEEVEVRLAESESLNSDMNQIKAELNKKIVELEKNQRPMIDQNRKLNERNKNLSTEIKRLESKIAHHMDDFLTLKDSHERVVKENASLKRERTFPEKLEELDRYRNQVLEYSKCITALRQAGLTVSKELQSNYEALYRENEELARALHAMESDDMSLREQLATARATIAQLQYTVDCSNERALQLDATAHHKVTIAQQTSKIQQMEEEIEKLQRNMLVNEEQRDLLEFQVMELRMVGEHSRQGSSADNVPEVEEIDYGLIKLSYQEICDMKADMRGMKRAGNFTADQRRSIAKAYAHLESLEAQCIEHEATCPGRGRIDLNGNSAQLLEEVCDLSKELGLVRYQLQTTEEELRAERSRADTLTNRLTVERDGVISELEDALKKQMDDLIAMRETLNGNKKRLEASEAERIKLQGDFNVLSAEYERFKAEQRPSIRTELERRFEETRYRLNEALGKIEKYEHVIDAARRVDENRSTYADELQKELEEVKEYNEHVERQFKTQTEIIDALKQRLVSIKGASDFLVSLTSSSSAEVSSRISDYVKASRDPEAKKTVSLVGDILEHCTREVELVAICDPLKLRECRSVDSGGDSLSNGSESSSRHSDDEDWTSNRSGSELRPGFVSPAAQSSR
ncbi:hypothetical protein PENTCL1PPCAC_29738 [Pristionchus entomophagus]|uniref:Uncharacterized protein n=1 Tax=Pristionchus entomophagus TaxID=358040 RepID=A0AAV5UKN4_9BILA|nr:hypothetical protein PENTCL1PPCAC_29738 [Pristionchus entomophagus]